MLLLILESLSTTELFFILVMALVFFGPRKLPQISRKLGRSLAEFRRASEDFKRTWEREVATENPLGDSAIGDSPNTQTLDLMDNGIPAEAPENRIDTQPGDHTIPRQKIDSGASVEAASDYSSEHTEPLHKRDWL